jgi:hypothetical protein
VVRVLGAGPTIRVSETTADSTPLPAERATVRDPRTRRPRAIRAFRAMSAALTRSSICALAISPVNIAATSVDPMRERYDVEVNPVDDERHAGAQVPSRFEGDVRHQARRPRLRYRPPRRWFAIGTETSPSAYR